MTWLSDEVLSAYIDGELPPAEAARVALALTRDPEAVQRLNALRDSDTLLREAFGWHLPGQTDLTERIAEKLEAPASWRRPAPMIATLAIGVVIAVAAGFGAGQLSAPREVQVDPEQGVTADGALGKALDSQASDVTGPLRIALTFRAKDGRYCRQFSWAGGVEGVACRDDRTWRIEELSAPSDPAGGDHGSDGPLDRAIAALGIMETLDLRQEARLIASTWRMSDEASRDSAAIRSARAAGGLG